MDSDQKTLNMATIGADTLARGARTRITSIQGYGIAASTLTLYDSVKFENGIVYNLAGAGGSVTVTITGA